MAGFAPEVEFLTQSPQIPLDMWMNFREAHELPEDSCSSVYTLCVCVCVCVCVTFSKFAKVSMTKMVKNTVTLFLWRKEAKKASKSCLGPQFQHSYRGWCSPNHQEILRHQLSVLQFSSVLTLSTSRKHYIPQMKGLVPQDHPPLQIPMASPDCHLGF